MVICNHPGPTGFLNVQMFDDQFRIIMPGISHAFFKATVDMFRCFDHFLAMVADMPYPMGFR